MNKNVNKKEENNTEEDNKITNKLSVHDRLTRSLMMNPKVAEEFFKVNLPDKIQEIIDFTSLRLKPDSFVDDNLKVQEADLLYSADFNGQPGFLYILFEHASSAQELLPFRMIKYMIAIMDKHLKEHETRKLPLVYPIILYNGRKPYAYSLDLFDLFNGSERELAKESLMSPCHLIDLTQASDEELQKYLYFGTLALTLKHIRDSDIYPFFTLIAQMLKELEKSGEDSYICSIMTYMAKAGKTEHPKEIVQVIKDLGLANEERIMGTLLEYLQPELLKRATDKAAAIAAEKALIKGRHERDVEIAKSLLLKGIDLNIISSATKLSKEEIKSLLP